MLGLNRFLAVTADKGIILVENLKAAQLSDAQTWETIGEIATGLAAPTTATLVASAAARSAVPDVALRSPWDQAASFLFRFFDFLSHKSLPPFRFHLIFVIFFKTQKSIRVSGWQSLP